MTQPDPAWWNLPASIDISAGANHQVRQYAMDAAGWMIHVTNLAAGLRYNSEQELIEADDAALPASEIATFTLSRDDFDDVVGTATISIVVPEPGYEFPEGSITVSAAELVAVPTFENIGLYWSDPTGSSSNECLVRFRPVGGTWRQGLSLWFDSRTGRPYGNRQYRGSIFGLQPNTTYEVEVLTKDSRQFKSTQVTTWNDEFPVGNTTHLPQHSTSQLDITPSQSGSAEGYHLYTFAPESSATIDVNLNADYCILVDASYIIIRGLTLKGARTACIGLTPNAHHVVIEGNEITEWGRNDPNHPEFGCNWSHGIATSAHAGSHGTRNYGVTHIVIQDNRIHHPNYTANSWDEPRNYSPECGVSRDGSTHPIGPHAMYFANPGGRFVIRHNSIYSSFDRMFNDAISGNWNFGEHGNLRSDSDVYGNSISHSWDDCIEIEGANMNVRIYENRSQHCFVHIATAETSVGPAYIMRNIASHGIHSPSQTSNRGSFWKHRSEDSSPLNASRMYVFHNTVYSVMSNDRIEYWFNGESHETAVANHFARNNIWETVRPPYHVPYTHSDYDYDLSPHSQWGVEQPNLILGTPTYDSGHSSSPYTLATHSLGLNAAQRIPNINDDFFGSGPDVGAQERGAEAIQFGARY